MAKRPSNNDRPVSTAKKTPSGSGGKRPANSGPAGSRATGSRPGGAKANAGRQSVAKARTNSNNSNRTQLIIGGVAVVLIIIVVVIGLVINKQKNAVQGDGYGDAKASTATVSNGAISIANGDPSVTIEVFEDAMCPICGEFEQQYGQQLAQYTDEGKVRINLHMLNFLNQNSASGDYSTRAAGALLAVATEAGDQPGLLLKFHSALFDSANQPAEGGSTDLTNDQLADLAVKSGAPESVRASISSGKYTQQAAANAEQSMTALRTAVGSVQTPTVLSNNKAVNTNDVDWLTNLVG
ncbi:DsbA family protein [Nakamurella lactea]|uniref:DsbA family protein n=1 Tax=Nakamurella lactea TaxID=459515 RepID=UPI0003F9A9FC|nr:thioredoxin domain-containing protein [Nakamurella lactea]